jgi:large conductance mechanosensitive channel
MRGNVVDLAVGVVIGAAFATVVTSFTDSFLKPLLAAIGSKNGEIGGMAIPLPGPENNALNFGSFISAIIGFVMTAAVVYFLVVLPMNKLAERRKRGEEPPPDAPSEEIKLLTEIRDALLAQRGVTAGATPGPRSAEQAQSSDSSR